MNGGVRMKERIIKDQKNNVNRMVMGHSIPCPNRQLKSKHRFYLDSLNSDTISSSTMNNITKTIFSMYPKMSKSLVFFINSFPGRSGPSGFNYSIS
jgi:hypothetical protein